jgi:thermitase
MTLTWSGARGTTVDVYRNGIWLKKPANTGRYTNIRAFLGPATYRYKVCEAGSLVCSNEATVQFSGRSAHRFR